MSIAHSSVKNPAAVAVLTAIVVLFGGFSFSGLPIQLFPEIERPKMSIKTSWRTASPREVEAEIVKPLEEVLQGIPGLKTLTSTASKGMARISLEFGLATDMNATLIEIISRLNRLPPLPADSDPPTVKMGDAFGGDSNKQLGWYFVQLLPGSAGQISDYQRLVEDLVKPRIENLEGVASVQVNAGAATELHITIDPFKAAELGVILPEISNVIGRANDVSGGFVDVGRRQYTLRFEGEYNPQELSQLVLSWRDGQPVYLGDIATVEVTKGRANGVMVQNGNPAMGIRIDKENGANVLETLDRVKIAVAELRQGPLKDAGLAIEQSFDASVFINRAVSLVTNNLGLGVFLAVGILWWFLRDSRATLLIAISIPVSLLATFIVLGLAGRSLNVISLAGLAFAVGMVLDAAIVVAENIVRLRERGDVPEEASTAGASQVQGALIASTATTVAIFIPVLFLKDVEGQLFADLALTIAIAVSISLVVALTILPALASRFLRASKLRRGMNPLWAGITTRILHITGTPARRYLWIAFLIITPLGATALLFPQLDYLPPVKRDAVDAFLNMPAGINVKTIEHEIVPELVERLRPYMDGEKQPALKNYYIWTWPTGGTIGVRIRDQTRIKELESVMRTEILGNFPGVRGFASQGNLFGGFGGGRAIAMHLQSRDEAGLNAAAEKVQQLMESAFPGVRVRARPTLQVAEPELRIKPNDRRINELGLGRRDLAQVVRMAGNGVWQGEYFDGEKRLDTYLKMSGWNSPETLGEIPLMTPRGGVVPLAELVDIERTTGPSQIRRIDGRRSVTLSFNPPEGISLESAMRLVREEIEPQARAALPDDGAILYAGSADSLTAAINSMGKNFAFALVILFLLMAGLFRSALDSAMVVLTIPLAGVGGVVGIQLLNLVTFQPMDLLTMIGFIILLGLVVNNAILLVHHARQAQRNGLVREEAVREALEIRLRPIFMSTLTSIFGMLPMLLLPGIGSVIYRGLATVIVGGMALSLVFTLLLLPSLLRLGKDKRLSDPAVAQPAPNLESVA